MVPVFVVSWYSVTNRCRKENLEVPRFPCLAWTYLSVENIFVFFLIPIQCWLWVNTAIGFKVITSIFMSTSREKQLLDVFVLSLTLGVVFYSQIKLQFTNYPTRPTSHFLPKSFSMFLTRLVRPSAGIVGRTASRMMAIRHHHCGGHGCGCGGHSHDHGMC